MKIQKNKIYIKRLRAAGKFSKTIVIPKKILNLLKINDNTALKIYIDDESRIIIEKIKE